MKFILKIAVISILILSAACKKKQPGARTAEEAKGDQPIAYAFAIKSAIAIYDAPEARAKAIATLPIGTRVDIFSSHVPDKKEPEKSFWYKVRYSPASAAADKPTAPVDGFVSEREEVLRQNFLIFKPKGEESVWDEATQKQKKVTGPFGVMAMTAVKLRKTPALNGQVIRTLNNGEVVTVLELSTAQVEIDKKFGEWYLVKDDQGVTGYAFGGYLVSGLYSELTALQNAGFRFTRGWIRINAANVKPLVSAQGNDIMDFKDTSAANAVKADGTFAKDTVLLVDAEVTKGAEKRYRAVYRFPIEDRYFQETRFYIPAAKVKYIADSYTISKASPHTVDQALADELNRHMQGDVNLQCTKVATFENGTSADARKFLAVETATGYVENDADGKPACQYAIAMASLLIEQKEGKNIFLGRMDETGAVFNDLDGDGIPEFISEHSHPRGGYSLHIFALKNDRLKSVFEYGGDRGQCVELGLKGKYIVADYSEYIKEKLKETGIPDYCGSDTDALKGMTSAIQLNKSLQLLPFYAKFEGGKFVQVEKPADLPAENHPAN